MNRRQVCLVAYLAMLLPGMLQPARAESIHYYGTVSTGVPLKVLSVDLKDLNVKLTGQLTQYGAGHAEPFNQMIRRGQPTIAITGTFFSVGSKIPIGDIVIDGQLAHFGGLGTALCVTENNEVEFVTPERYTHQDWSAYDFVLCSGPRLIRDGIPYVNPWPEGFHDRNMLSRNARIAIGVTKDNRLLIVVTRKPIYLSKLARAMRNLGVVNAINLDGGSSIGVFYKGKMIIKPRRWLTNLILVYRDRWRYEEMKEGLLPIRLRAANRG